MHLFINSKQKKQQTCTNITKYNWVLMPCPSTVALQLCETCFPEVSSALWRVRGAEAMLTLRQCRETQRIQKDSQKSRSNSLFLSSCCQDAVLLASEATRM